MMYSPYHIMSYCIMPLCIKPGIVVSYCQVRSYHIISYHIISYHITSHHITSYHIISYYVSYHNTFYCITSYFIILYQKHIMLHAIFQHTVSHLKWCRENFGFVEKFVFCKIPERMQAFTRSVVDMFCCSHICAKLSAGCLHY